ncbi:hypothetical protein Plano_1567 [Planococcus sp. PAMC 21323]|uniref:hypothetical protein n=1 Tax=Planococcus sp. PAMC 21323 TaxID=1526927 RepID=UPI00056F9A7F|nr:hypothetical protein [Planococcus sp. PAMC 21323]AIY05532.1 hypothetical protein Plano_1567 [Planococcus sp. PAMC 21323]
MKIAKKFTLLLFLILLMLGACTTPEFEPYKGRSLTVAVLGTSPEVNEKQIDFEEISFGKFTTDELKKYDAVFITIEKLSQAAESQYSSTYLESHIPFFFIESNKGEYPFIDSNLAYEEAREIPYHNYYATGFLETTENVRKTWTFDLYNDEVNEENIKELFSRIFKTIEENPGNALLD